jgi:two-component system nitrogen regulation response regulator GlnG
LVVNAAPSSPLRRLLDAASTTNASDHWTILAARMRDAAETVETLDTGPQRASLGEAEPLAPRLEILFHADLARVGDVARLDPRGDEALIGRKSPGFSPAGGGEERPLADRFVSREQLAVAWRADRRSFALRPLASARLPAQIVALDGGAPIRIDRAIEVPPGTAIAIGDRALLLLAAGPARAPDDDRLGMIGEGDGAWTVRDRVAAIARFREGVLVLGETGAGKELVARAVHERSGGGPFVALNMGGIEPGTAGSELFGHVRGAFTGADRDAAGAFEVARGGTVFLDEIGDAPLEVQKKLLRVLEDRRFSPIGSQRRVELACRVIAATNRPLAADIAAGQFRRDLYERIAALTVPVPPLRQRREDVPRLFVHFLAAQAAVHPALARLFGGGEAPDPPVPMSFFLALLRHAWPGNIRELRNHATATAAANLGGGRFIAPPLAEEPSAPAPRSLDDAARDKPTAPIPEAETIEATLTACRGNVRAAATRLGCSRYQLYRWMEARGIDPARYRSGDDG